LGFLALGIDRLAKEFWEKVEMETKVEREMTLRLAGLWLHQRWPFYLSTPLFHSPSEHGTILLFPQGWPEEFLSLLFPRLCVLLLVLLAN
jgi:hypothetical protein